MQKVHREALDAERVDERKRRRQHTGSGARAKPSLHDLYQNQFIDVCGFPYVTSFEMVKKKGKTGYFLFYGTRNTVGLRVMKDGPDTPHSAPAGTPSPSRPGTCTATGCAPPPQGPRTRPTPVEPTISP